MPWPEDLKKAGLVGPGLTALIGFLKSACHMSFSSLRKFLRDVVGLTISRGQLRKVVAKVSDSLKDPYEELVALLPDEEHLNVDETGHKDQAKRLWTWCFRAALFTVFKISPSRGSDVLLEVLGTEFDGVLGCDYGPFQKNCNIFGIFRSGKGDRPLLPERPAGRWHKRGLSPFLSVRYFDSVAVLLR